VEGGNFAGPLNQIPQTGIQVKGVGRRYVCTLPEVQELGDEKVPETGGPNERSKKGEGDRDGDITCPLRYQGKRN